MPSARSASDLFVRPSKRSAACIRYYKLGAAARRRVPGIYQERSVCIIMNLQGLRGSYDAIYSLGHLCLASIQLEKNGIRPFAGPLDWMASPSLPDVNRLLANRFHNFMAYPHLVTVNRASDKLYNVHETFYNVFSNHDFYTHNNFPPHLAAYPEVKAKYDRRVKRLLDKARTCKRLLFIRTEASLEDAKALERVLSGLVANDFRLLVVNHLGVSGMVELNWPLQRVCALAFPNQEIWDGNDALWTQVFRHIQLVDSL